MLFHDSRPKVSTYYFSTQVSYQTLILFTESNGTTRTIEKTLAASEGKSVTRKKAASTTELVGPGRPVMGDASSTAPVKMVKSKKRNSESAALSISSESAGAAAKKSKVMTSDEANQPAQKPSIPRPVAKKANSEANRPVQNLSVSRPRPRPVAKKAKSSPVISGNAQETMLDKGNKKRSNPAGDDGGNAGDATPIRPVKKLKSSAQPLRRTGCYMFLPEFEC
jgi:hypothetical protein